MKKKFCFLCILILLLVVGCDGTITREIRHGGYNLGGQFACTEFMPSSDEDVYYTKIKYYIGSHIVTENGKLYEVSLEKKFSNDSNCRVVDKDITVEGILDNKIVRSTDGKLYTLVTDNNAQAYSVIDESNQNFKLYKVLLGDKSNIKVVTVDNNSGKYYILKNDGDIYSYIVEKVGDYKNQDYKVTSSSIIFNKNDYSGNIVDFNYAGDNLNTFVLTADKLFRMRVKNIEECGKYADIVCEYEMKEDPIYETYKDKIIVFNGSTLITTYGKMFSVAS